MITRHSFTPRADAEIDEIVLYMAEQSPEAAIRFYDRIGTTIERLKEWPGLGRSCEMISPHLHDLRTYSVDGFPNHQLYYTIRDDVLFIVRVLHSARDRDRLLGQRDLG